MGEITPENDISFGKQTTICLDMECRGFMAGVEASDSVFFHTYFQSAL